MAQSALVPSELPRSVALFDLSYSFRRHWHAQNADAEVNDAPRAVLAELASVRAAVDHVIVCVDSPPYFRKELYPAYKAQREAPSDGMKAAMKWLKGRIDADGYQVAAAPTFEADDVIASLSFALTAYRDVEDIAIIGCDKDMAQCVSDQSGRIRQFVPAVGNREAIVLDGDGVRGKFGVSPHQMPEYQALVGDTGDNIEGVPGIGPKRAAQILQAYGSLTELYADLESDSDRDMNLPLSEKMLSVLRFAKANVFRDVQLTTLRTDVPLDVMALLARKEVQKLVEVPTVEDVMPEEDFVPISPPPGVARLTPLPPLPPKPAQEQTEAIVVRQEPYAAPATWAMELQPRNPSQAIRYAAHFYNARLYSKFDNADAILAVIIRGRELGIGMTTALDSFHVIEGKPAPSADLIRSLAEADPNCEYLMPVSFSSTEATWETKHRKHPRPIKYTYTIEDAKKADLVKPGRSGKPSNWQTRPQDMLVKTAGSKLARMAYPGATCGLYCAEEMEST